MDLLGDLGKTQKTTSSEDQSHKVRMVVPSGSESSRGFTETERELLRTLARQGLANEQQIRMLKAVTDVHRVSTSGPIVQSTKASMDALITAQRRLKQEQSLDNSSIQERLGPAHLHVWNGLVKCAVEHAEKGSEEEKLVQAYISTIRAVWDYMPDVRMARMENMHESKHKKLVIHVTPAEPRLVEKDETYVLQDSPSLTAHTIWPVMRQVFQKIDKTWKFLPGMAHSDSQ